jgi:hypothetical protein
MDECAERVRKVFGIYSVSPAVEMEKDLDAICRQAAEMMKGMRGSFKVLCKRSDKKFPLNSQELAAKVGEAILEVNDKLVVDVHDPEIKMKVDIRDHAYLCNTEIMAVGGLPMIKAMSAPYGSVRFMPTGGINQKNILSYLENPKVLCCGGSWMVPEDKLLAEDFDAIEALVREATQLVKNGK